MLKEENYAKAYKEVFEILKYVNKEDLEKIPNTFMQMLQKKMDKNYDFTLNSNKEFEEQEMLRETKAILAYIYVNYWCDEKEKKIIKNKFKNDLLKEEIAKQERFSNDVFKNVKKENVQNKANSKVKEENKVEKNIDKLQMVPYTKKNFISKIIEKLKMIIKIQK